MRYGIISTGNISHEFTKALKATDGAEVTAVYSREAQRAENFIAKHKLAAQAFTSVEELCASDAVDAVYVASPNDLHRDHALAAINAGKHVVVEKPAVFDPEQWLEVWSAADAAHVLVFEAARHVYEPAQEKIIEAIAGRTPASVRLNYSQYSSRWDAVLAGEEPNIFSLKHGGGALVDLGVYSVYDAVLWFGAPHTLHFVPSLAPTGVDASGTLVLNYGKFNVAIMTSKNAQSDVPSEILFGKESIKLSSVQGIDRVTRTIEGKEETLYTSDRKVGHRSLSELMQYEAAFFTQMFEAMSSGTLSDEEKKIYQGSVDLAQTVNKVTSKARHSAAIFFEGETRPLTFL